MSSSLLDVDGYKCHLAPATRVTTFTGSSSLMDVSGYPLAPDTQVTTSTTPFFFQEFEGHTSKKEVLVQEKV